MIETYEYTITRQCQAFKIPEQDSKFWEDNEGQLCFKFTFCPRLILKEGIVYLQSVTEATLKGSIGDYLVFQHGELMFVKEKVFKLKYKKYDISRECKND